MYARAEAEGWLLHDARIMHDRRTRKDYVEGVLVVGEIQTPKGRRWPDRLIFRSRRKEDIARVGEMREGRTVRVAGGVLARMWHDDDQRIWGTPLVPIDGPNASLEVLP